MMKSFVDILVSIAVLFNAVNGVSGDDHDCPGLRNPDVVTSIDFHQSEVTVNTLHIDGGELRYSGVGVFEGQSLDLRVTVTHGDYPNIATVWDDREKPIPNHGTATDSSFGVINLQTVKNEPTSGEGNFRMCFVKTGTNNRVTLEQFSWSIYDLDERGSGIKEKFIINTFQAAVFQLWPDPANSEVQVSCTDGSDPPCPPEPTVRTIFESSTVGNGGDNPSDPNNLTDLQKKRSVVFTFVDRDCWDFTYNHYCPMDQPGYTGPGGNDCSFYSGGNFLFAGNSDEIIQQGECITPAPVPITPSPTWSPTETPTPWPTPPPTPPTPPPTLNPTPNPPTGNPTTRAPTPIPFSRQNDPNDPGDEPFNPGTGIMWQIKLGSLQQMKLVNAGRKRD